jgi:hypothetical protein
VEDSRHVVPEILHDHESLPSVRWATDRCGADGQADGMTNKLSRTLAAAGAVVLLSTVGALTMTESAHATPIDAGTGIRVDGPTWDKGSYDVYLDGTRTDAAIRQGLDATGSMCTAVINHMSSFPDEARGSTCWSALEVCARWARTAPKNNANSRTRFYLDGSIKCLDA